MPIFLFGLVVLNVITLMYIILKNVLIDLFTNYVNHTPVAYKIAFAKTSVILLLFFSIWESNLLCIYIDCTKIKKY